MITLTHDAVATHAYFIWEGEGRPHGCHEGHWFAAETALMRAAAPVLVEAAPAEKAAVETASLKPAVRKTAASKKTAAPKAPALPKATSAKATSAKPPKAETVAPLAGDKAPAETVVAAAALKAPRTARATSKGSRTAH